MKDGKRWFKVLVGTADNSWIRVKSVSKESAKDDVESRGITVRQVIAYEEAR